jgi:hypothetical protein
MGADEEGTLERLEALRRELLDPKISERRGRIVKRSDMSQTRRPCRDRCHPCHHHVCQPALDLPNFTQFN